MVGFIIASGAIVAARWIGRGSAMKKIHRGEESLLREIKAAEIALVAHKEVMKLFEGQLPFSGSDWGHNLIEIGS